MRFNTETDARNAAEVELIIRERAASPLRKVMLQSGIRFVTHVKDGDDLALVCRIYGAEFVKWMDN